jgi:hypothetical protein
MKIKKTDLPWFRSPGKLGIKYFFFLLYIFFNTALSAARQMP